MARKIIFSFTENPQVGDAFGFNFFLNGLAIPINGFLGVALEYNNTADIPPFEIKIKSTLSDTIDRTLFFLNSVYFHPNLIYKRVNNTIEVLMNIEGVTDAFSFDADGRITAISSDVEPDEDLGLIYFFEYTNSENDHYLCKINKVGYNGNSTEINGKATLTKGRVKDHLEPFRGTGLDIELEANVDLTLSDLYSDDERTFTVRFYKNNKLVFRGFMKPDGVFESFTRDRWVIQMSCIDGLGTLENLSFVKNDGFFFVGRLKAFDIIFNCLNRIGMPMKINTCINTYYDGLTPTDSLDPLQNIYLSADRFVKIDNNTIMSCEEVLKSVLDIFCAVITQVNGEWYIYKPNELYKNTYPKFRRYSEKGDYLGINQLNVNYALGSQIDNYYPHHCGGNQKKEIKGAVSAFRLGYKYGKISGLLTNPNFDYSGNISIPYEDWILNFPDASGSIILDPTNKSGFLTKVRNDNQSQIFLAKNTGVTLQKDFEYTLRANITLSSFPSIFKTVFLIYKWAVVLDNTYYLDINGNWTTVPTQIEFEFAVDVNDDEYTTETVFEFSTKTAKLPISGNAVVELYTVKFLNQRYSQGYAVTEFNTVDFLPANTDTLQGEFHTVQRKNKVSTIIKTNKEVFNGDRTAKEYIGDIFKSDKINTTSTWFRKGVLESFPLLRIAAEEELRISQKPLVAFSGDTFGEVPYLSVIKINNIDGVFMPIEWEFDTFKNTCKIKSLQLYSEELDDIDYKLSFDYGNTVKPTIKG